MAPWSQYPPLMRTHPSIRAARLRTTRRTLTRSTRSLRQRRSPLSRNLPRLRQSSRSLRRLKLPPPRKPPQLPSRHPRRPKLLRRRPLSRRSPRHRPRPLRQRPTSLLPSLCRQVLLSLLLLGRGLASLHLHTRSLHLSLPLLVPSKLPPSPRLRLLPHPLLPHQQLHHPLLHRVSSRRPPARARQLDGNQSPATRRSSRVLRTQDLLLTPTRSVHTLRMYTARSRKRH
jgi:hypothetical protein